MSLIITSLLKPRTDPLSNTSDGKTSVCDLALAEDNAIWLQITIASKKQSNRVGYVFVEPKTEAIFEQQVIIRARAIGNEQLLPSFDRTAFWANKSLSTRVLLFRDQILMHVTKSRPVL